MSITDRDVGFDVYFVPSQDQLDNFVEGRAFEFYAQSGCHAQNHRSFGGLCENVTRGSGLLLVLPDHLDLSLTKVRVSLHELV